MVRTRTDEKRREIVRVAAQAFQELGYERTSMLTIAERLRGSKQTLYNYFPSKEELLKAVLDFDVNEATDQALDEFVVQKNLRKALTRLGEVYLARQLAPQAISNFRTVATQPPGSGIGDEFYRNILCPSWERVADAFETLMSQGKLKRADPWLATMHFKGLATQDLLERELLGASGQVSEKDIRTAARQAADAFVLIYGADRSEAAGKGRKHEPA